MTLAIIPNDGYTERAVLHEVPHLHPRVEFRFRPMLVAEVADYWQQAEGLKGAQLRRLVAAHLANKVKEWDVKDDRGEAVPVTAANVMLLKDHLFKRLFGVVSGQEPPDAAPDRSPEEARADFEDVLKAAESGRSVREVREEREAKNS